MTTRPLEGPLHLALDRLAAAGRPCAVAVVLHASGSTPGRAGTRAVLEADGSIWGTVGGGAVEAETRRRAADILRSGQPAVFDFALEGRDPADPAPVCGGRMRLLIDPNVAPHRAASVAAAEAQDRRQTGLLLAILRHGPALRVSTHYLPADARAGLPAFPPAEALQAAVAQRRPLFVTEQTAPEPLEALVDPVLPPPLLVIAGGGHVGQALAAEAARAGFGLVVLDDRPEFAVPDLYPPGTRIGNGPIAAALASFPVDAQTYIAIVTRGHRQDAAALAAAVRQPAAYVGMMGSRRKVALLRRELLAAGQATAADLDRVYAPIGLEIGAQTVPEIAVSIVAQLIAVRRTGAAPRFAPEPEAP